MTIANIKKPAVSPIEVQPIRVALAGDSLTELTQYPNYAQEILGGKYLVGNFGACGSTISLDSDNPYLYTQAFEGAIRFQPNITVIMLGTNDACITLERYQGNLADDYIVLLTRVLSLVNRQQIWIVKPPPVFNETVGLSVDLFDRGIIPAIETVAREENFPLIDVYSACRSYFLDGVHPNDAGAKTIADVICNAILPKEHMLK
jgi:acyl-CoA thioesterase-1